MTVALTVLTLLTLALLFAVAILSRGREPHGREVEDLDDALERSAMSDATMPLTLAGKGYRGSHRRTWQSGRLGRLSGRRPQR